MSGGGGKGKRRGRSTCFFLLDFLKGVGHSRGDSLPQCVDIVLSLVWCGVLMFCPP